MKTSNAIVNAHAYAALEMLRLAIGHFGTVVESAPITIAADDDDEIADCTLTAQDAYEYRASLKLVAAALQENVSGVPSIPERCFTAVRDWTNREQGNMDGAEGAVIASAFAVRLLADACYAADEDEPLYEMLTGARWVAQTMDMAADVVIGGWKVDEIIDAIIAGEPVAV